jgi:hypothetical protein
VESLGIWIKVKEEEDNWESVWRIFKEEEIRKSNSRN